MARMYHINIQTLSGIADFNIQVPSNQCPGVGLGHNKFFKPFQENVWRQSQNLFKKYGPWRSYCEAEIGDKILHDT